MNFNRTNLQKNMILILPLERMAGHFVFREVK